MTLPELDPEFVKRLEDAWVDFESTVLKSQIVIVRYLRQLEGSLKQIYVDMGEQFGSGDEGFDRWIDFLAKLYGMERE